MSRDRSRALCILLFESVLTCLCCVAAIWIRFGSEAINVLSSFQGWSRIALSMVIVQSSFYIFDLYDFRLIRRRHVRRLH